jgi:aryl-alcohol dehydrogenase-like predicted oxidoreductase
MVAAVEYVRLGQSGIEVSRIALGCGNFGGIGSAPAFFGRGESRDHAFELMDAAWEAGITHFDTADAYGGGRSERWIGEWMRARGVRPVLTTKVFHSVEGDPADEGLAPERIRRQLPASLERLGVDAVDVYLTHEPDPDVPLAETVGALAALVAEGLVRAFGLSNGVTAAELELALDIAGPACVQEAYSLLDRAAEEELLPLCADRGVAFTAFSPLSGGWLAGKYRRGEPFPADSRMATRPEGMTHLRDGRVFDALAALDEEARARGVDSATLSLAWLLGDRRVAALVVGPRRPSHLEPALAALELDLTEPEREEVSALFSALPV